MQEQEMQDLAMLAAADESQATPPPEPAHLRQFLVALTAWQQEEARQQEIIFGEQVRVCAHEQLAALQAHHLMEKEALKNRHLQQQQQARAEVNGGALQGGAPGGA